MEEMVPIEKDNSNVYAAEFIKSGLSNNNKLFKYSTIHPKGRFLLAILDYII
jgi:hypothetical protein